MAKTIQRVLKRRARQPARCRSPPLHFLAAIPNSLELEFDQNPNGLRDGLLKESLAIDGDGMVTVPQRPGFGIALDPAAVARYCAG